MTRSVTAAIALALVAAVLALDFATADLNPFEAPPIVALGSGLAGGGAFCGELPD